MQFFLIYVGTSWLFSGPSVFDGYECLYSHSKRTDDQSAAKEMGIISQLSYGHPKRTGGQSSAKEKGDVAALCQTDLITLTDFVDTSIQNWAFLVRGL